MSSKFFFICASIFIFSLSSFSQVVTIYEVRNVEIAGKLSEYTVTGIVPKTIKNRQRVIDVRFSPKEPEIFMENDVTYYKMVLDESDGISKERRLEIRMDYDIELFFYDLSWAKYFKDGINDTFNIAQYTDKEHFERISVKKLSKIKADVGEDSTRVGQLEKIHQYVLQTLEYDYAVTENIGAVRALRKGRGDFTEYAELFVALSRAFGFPARVISGAIARTANNPSHNWVEVYLDEYGWVPFDPAFSDGDSSRWSFNNLGRWYIYKTKGKVDPYLGSASKKYSYKWLDYGRLTSNSFYGRSWERTSQMGTAGRHYNNHDYDSALFILNELIIFDNKNPQYLTFKGMIFARMGHVGEGRSLFQLALREAVHDYQKMDTYYSYANFLSLIGDVENSMKYLEASLKLGFVNFEHIMKDEDLVLLRESSGFEELVDRYRNQ